MTHSDSSPSSIRDDSICESSLNPNKSSGDIGERTHAPTNDADLLMWCTACPTESAAEIERLRREVESLQRALVFWMPGVDLRLDEATRERAAQDAGLLAGYTGPTDGPCWGDGMLDRALSAESAVAAAWEEAAKKSADDLVNICEAAQRLAHRTGNTFVLDRQRVEAMILGNARASAIRAAVSKKTAESGHSPSTHNSASE